jgi:hypothetical protein
VLRLGGTLGGTGEVVINGGEVSVNSLTVGPGVTVRPGTAGGTFGRASESGSFTNQGTFSSTVAGKTLNVNGTVFNEGLFEARNGGAIRVVRPALFGGNLRGGTWAVYEGSTIDFGPNATVSTNSAEVILDGPGSMLDAVSPMQTNAGRFTLGRGRDFDSTARRGLTNTGTLTLSAATDLHTRSFAQAPAATLNIELAGTGGEAVSHLLVDGAASLHGVLGVSVVDGFLPRPGDEFDVLTAGLISGRFSGLTTTGLAPGSGHLEPIYSERSLTLRFVEGPGLTTVPEPSALVCVPATLWLVGRRRRRQPLSPCNQAA